MVDWASRGAIHDAETRKYGEIAESKDIIQLYQQHPNLDDFSYSDLPRCNSRLPNPTDPDL